MKTLSDWSSLPRDLYVISARTEGIGYEVEMCSVPMVTAPEVRYVRADAFVEADRARRAMEYYADQFCEGWCDQDAGCAHFDDCSGCLARRVLGGVPDVKSTADRVITELMDRRLLNDVDDDLWPEIAAAVIKAVRG